MSESNKIVLKSSDGEFFEVDEAVAREFQIVAHMIEDGCVGKPIPLINVGKKALSLVIEYCKKHVEAGKVEETVEATEELKKWDKEFTKDMDMDMLVTLILAANYLNINGLLDVVSRKIADTIKEKQPEEVRKIFNIKNDFTPEEEATVRKENEWAFK